MTANSRLGLLIANSVIDSIVIFMLLQLLCFHLYLIARGMTTYEFITKNKVNPVLTKQPLAENKPPPVDEAINPQVVHERSTASLQGRQTEGVRLMEPLEGHGDRRGTELSTGSKKTHSEEGIGNDEFHQQPTQRVETLPKEMIIKHKPRKSLAEKNHAM